MMSGAEGIVPVRSHRTPRMGHRLLQHTMSLKGRRRCVSSIMSVTAPSIRSKLTFLKQWHVFYIDSSNVLQEMINSNTSQGWTKGPLGKAGIRAVDAPSVGLGVDYTTANPLSNVSEVGVVDNSVGLRLYYGASGSVIQELSWTLEDDVWSMISRFEDNVNGYGGISATGAGTGWAYVYMLTSDNRLQLHWSDDTQQRNNSSGATSGFIEGRPPSITSR